MSIEESNSAKPSGFLSLLWALFFFSVFTILVFIWISRSNAGESVDAIRAAKRVATRDKSFKEDHEKLSVAAWIDQTKGTVRMPIVDAMKLVASELSAKKEVVSQIKVEPSLPLPAPYDPNAAEPAPPALPSAPQGADTIRFEPAKPTPSASVEVLADSLVAKSSVSDSIPTATSNNQ